MSDMDKVFLYLYKNTLSLLPIWGKTYLGVRGQEKLVND